MSETTLYSSLFSLYTIIRHTFNHLTRNCFKYYLSPQLNFSMINSLIFVCFGNWNREDWHNLLFIRNWRKHGFMLILPKPYKCWSNQCFIGPYWINVCWTSYKYDFLHQQGINQIIPFKWNLFPLYNIKLRIYFSDHFLVILVW